MTKEILVTEILNILNRKYPQAATMLKYSSIFELLISVILSAQSTDEQVNKVTARLFKKYNAPEDFAHMELALLEKEIKGVGLYRNKARSIKEMSIMLLDKYAGNVPDDFEDLLTLPGVGRKTANVVLAVGFNKPALGVDTHVHRLANRLGLVNETKPEKTERALKDLIPKEWWIKAHHLFIFHGRKVCKARIPLCDICEINKLCAKMIKK